jgi:hypothetical protein
MRGYWTNAKNMIQRTMATLPWVVRGTNQMPLLFPLGIDDHLLSRLCSRISVKTKSVNKKLLGVRLAYMHLMSS